MEINYNKLLSAIELVAFNKLDECRDDTLIEKLVSVFDLSFNELNCPDQLLHSIYNLCKEAVDLWSNLDSRSNIFVGPVFSFIFKLISSHSLQNVIGRKEIIPRLRLLFDLKKNVFDCDYSIQSYYIKGLTKLFSNRDGSKIVFEENLIDKSFVQFLIDQGLKSQSFFVAGSIQQCLVEVIRRSTEFNEDRITIKYFSLIVTSLEFNLNKFHIKIIGQLLSEDYMKRKLSTLFPDLNQILISRLSPKENSINLHLIELLANNLDNESQINFVFIKLIKNNLLKPLICYSSNLAANRNSDYINKWFIYVVLPLEIYCNSDLDKSQINYFQYSDYDRQLVSSLINEKSLIYSLHYLKTQFPNSLNKNQLEQVFNIINQFVRNLIDNSKIKLLKESILMIGSLDKQINELEPKLFAILIDLLITFLWSSNEQFQCECLIWLRRLFDDNIKLLENNEIRGKLINLLNRLLSLKLDDENRDLIDGALELIDVLIKTNHFNISQLNNDHLKSIFEIWKYSVKHSDNYSLKASCISILFNLQFSIDRKRIDEILASDSETNANGNESIDLLEIVWKCLKDENSLVRRKVIESIRDNILNNKSKVKCDAIDKLITNDSKLYLEICYHLSESILFDIDADIQLASIDILKNLIIDLLNTKLDASILNQKLRGLIYYVHSLNFTLMNNLVCFTVKEQCLSVLDEIRDCLAKNSISKDDFLSILDENVSVFEYKVDGFRKKDLNNIEENSSAKKEKHLDEMFKDNVFRAEEIIEQFANERSNCSLPTESTKTAITNKIDIKNLLEFLFTFDRECYINNKIEIDFLDDILAAKANDDVILDCY